MSRDPRQGTVPTSRAERSALRRRRGLLIGVASVAALVLAVSAFLLLRDEGDGSPSVVVPDGAAVDADAPTSMAFQIKGTTAPSLAIIGAATNDHAGTVMPMPQDLTIVGPGQGEITIPEVAGLAGESIRVDLSNMAGIWLDTYVIVSLGGFSDMVDRSGGLPVTLSQAYPTRSGSIGPGALTLDGRQAKAFLAGSTDDAATRWEIVLAALLANPPALEDQDLLDSDDPAAAAQVFAGAAGADMTQVPTTVFAGTVRVPNYDALDRIMADSFDAEPPTPAIVQNGNGEAGVGEAVGADLIPAGFRITLSQNAQTFDVATTDVFANGTAFEADAMRARKALGVGRVRVSQVPSGIGDVLIVVGKDFTR